MINEEFNKSDVSLNESEGKVCDLNYLNEMMGHKNHLIMGIMEVFLTQIPEELQCMNEAVAKTNYPTIKSFAHTMKSSVSIMGVAILVPILKEMEALATEGSNIERIRELNQKLNAICKKSVQEIEIEKNNYL